MIIFDEIVDYLSRDEPSEVSQIPGARKKMGPKPLLPYPESATGIGYSLDVMVTFLACVSMLYTRLTWRYL